MKMNQRSQGGVYEQGERISFGSSGRSPEGDWRDSRSSSFYFRREIAAQPGRTLGRRGPKTAWSDAALLEKIREVIDTSPFYGEGHRKVWARLRFAEVRTSKARVLRLMREAQLLAPSRTLPRAENPHTGTIITERPNEVWASDHTMLSPVSRSTSAQGG